MEIIRNRNDINESENYQLGICRDLRRVCTLADLFDTDGLDHLICFVIDQFPARLYAMEDWSVTDEWHDFLNNIPYMEPEEIRDWLVNPWDHFKGGDRE